MIENEAKGELKKYNENFSMEEACFQDYFKYEYLYYANDCLFVTDYKEIRKFNYSEINFNDKILDSLKRLPTKNDLKAYNKSSYITKELIFYYVNTDGRNKGVLNCLVDFPSLYIESEMDTSLVTVIKKYKLENPFLSLSVLPESASVTTNEDVPISKPPKNSSMKEKDVKYDKTNKDKNENKVEKLQFQTTNRNKNFEQKSYMDTIPRNIEEEQSISSKRNKKPRRRNTFGGLPKKKKNTAEFPKQTFNF
jgi:hypothetical protein